MKPKSLHLILKHVWKFLLFILPLLAFSNNSIAQCSGNVLIDNESFESGWGIWNDGGVDCDRVATNPNTGTYSINIRDNSGDPSSMTTNSLDLSTYSEIRVAFSYYVSGFNNSTEDFWLRISTDGGSNFTTVEEWNRDDEFNNNERKYDTITIAGPFTSNTQVRFECDASGNGNNVYIDDVVICAVNPNSAPSAVSDNSTSNTEAIAIDVLSNDSDPQGDNIALDSITVAPNHGAIASINNNGTPGDLTDDYIDFDPSGAYFGVETLTYQICDDGSPSLCSTATVNVTVSPNTAPNAVADNASTSIASSTTVNVLSNDSDANGGQTITLSAITVAPNQGGTAIINNNGTVADPTDDYIDFTPSGLYTGIETFTYQICDNAQPIACATAVVSVNITTCPDGSTPEASPSFAFGSEWKYDDSGLDLGTSWRNLAYVDACWLYGNANIGFGDPMTTTITDHGKYTYYFRKHFNVADANTINYLKLDLIRDDGAVVYINGNEVLRSNMPTGTISNTTPAVSNVSGAEETQTWSVLVPASYLVNGDNVIAVEVHQDALGSSDINFDLAMTADIVDHSADIYIAQGEYWNYSDDGTDLLTAWRSSSYIETTENWETGTAELGYGDGDESTVIGTGTVYPTYYFRHYFNADDIIVTDSLHIKLRKDDGAVVYVNGVEVFRHGVASGPVAYGDWATFTAAGADETKFYDTTIMASMITAGINVVAVEVHQTSSTSSDVSFELEMSKIDGDPNNYPITYETVSGKIFLDLDVSRSFSPGDFGEGALEVFSYYDRNSNGNIDLDSDPRLFSYLTDINGDYEVNTYHAEVKSIKSDISSSNEDAVEDGLVGAMSLGNTTQSSVVNYLAPTLIFDTLSSWKYFDGGDVADPTWIELGYAESGWSTGTGDFGFGDPGITTTLASGNTTYYFRKSFAGGASAGVWNAGRIKVKRDDGIVVYLNGVEVARNNMPTGPIDYSTFAAELIDGEAEGLYIDLLFTEASYNVGTNVIAVEIHQVNGSSSDVHFDMSLSAESSAIADVGFRFGNIDIPQGAKIIDAFMRVTSATTTEDFHSLNIEGENSDNAAVFSSSAYDITNRPRTTANQKWSNAKSLLDGREFKIADLTEIVQEIIDRTGWSSGNAMAFFLSGYDFDIYTFDGGYATELTISYLDTNQTTAQYLIGVLESDLPDVHTFMTDPSPAVTVGSGLRAIANVNIGYIGSTGMCMASSDDGYDALHIINRFSGKNKRIGAFGGSTEIEAIALSKNADSLFAVDGDQFGLIDLSTGAFTPYGPVIGTANGAEGAQSLDDVDGLSYDLTRDILWATDRRSGTYDLIFVLDIATGQFTPDAFGPGVDYIIAQGGGLLHDLDDIAVNPNTGNLFAMNNDNGAITNLVEIDINSGSPNVINNTGLNDMEGQGFHNDGLFYSTSGRLGIPDNAFYRVDTSNSFLTLVGFFDSEGDFEGCDCKSGHSVNFIDGVVFEDLDENGNYNQPDILDEGVDVFLFRDLDSNGVFTPGVDTLIATQVTDSAGYYAFATTTTGYFVIIIDTTDIPLNAILINTERSARFGVNGQVELGSDFGYRYGNPLPVELAYFDGENKGQENNLYWTTTAEINNDYFNVQRSSDAINFETIGVVNGAGNSNEKIQYEFVDEQPFNGINYYRLQQVDFDGTNEYSKIIDLEVTSKNAEASISLDVFPNPSHDFVKIGGLEKLNIIEEVTLFVYDINGVEKFTRLFTIDADIIQLDISEFENGMYFADLSSASKGLIQSMNFIKQNR